MQKIFQRKKLSLKNLTDLQNGIIETSLDSKIINLENGRIKIIAQTIEIHLEMIEMIEVIEIIKVKEI